MKLGRILLFLVPALVLFAGCREVRKGKVLLPTSDGAICEVQVVLDKASWTGELGQAYREVLTEQYPFLPRKEPYFKLVNVIPAEYGDTAKIFRNIVVTKVDSTCREPRMEVKGNVYAQSQVVVCMVASSDAALAAYIRKSGVKLRELLDQSEKERFAHQVKVSSDADLAAAVKDKFGFDLFVPMGYQLRSSKPDFMWLSLESSLASQGLLIFTSPYDGAASFAMRNLSASANGYTQQYVPGPTNGSYMVNDLTITPKVEQVTRKGRAWYRMRGYWSVTHEFMGGSYVSYSTYWKERNEVLHIRAYIYSPKKDMRRALLRTESLMLNIKLNGE